MRTDRGAREGHGVMRCDANKHGHWECCFERDAAREGREGWGGEACVAFFVNRSLLCVVRILQDVEVLPLVLSLCPSTTSRDLISRRCFSCRYRFAATTTTSTTPFPFPSSGPVPETNPPFFLRCRFVSFSAVSGVRWAVRRRVVVLVLTGDLAPCACGRGEGRLGAEQVFRRNGDVNRS